MDATSRRINRASVRTSVIGEGSHRSRTAALEPPSGRGCGYPHSHPSLSGVVHRGTDALASSYNQVLTFYEAGIVVRVRAKTLGDALVRSPGSVPPGRFTYRTEPFVPRLF